jgi:hypothetical protein
VAFAAQVLTTLIDGLDSIHLHHMGSRSYSLALVVAGQVVRTFLELPWRVLLVGCVSTDPHGRSHHVRTP